MSPRARTKAKQTAKQREATKRVEQENAEHEAFLATYEPVITRHPDALAAERAEADAAVAVEVARLSQEEAERDTATAAQLAAQQAREQEEADYRAEHYPGT